MAAEYMTSHYDYRLVALSIIVAIAASYTALDTVGRIRAAERWHAYSWLTAGALAMGTGIWSMHFIGMMAFILPTPMGYDVGVTALSWVMAVAASLMALHLASRVRMTWGTLLCGASLMAAAILGMHYTGMAAMQMMPVIVYDPVWVFLSIVVALMASAAGLWMAFELRDKRRLRSIVTKSGAATFKGLAIAGAHYTAMAGARFPIDSVCGAANGLNSNWLAVLVGASTILLLGIALIAAALDRRLENHTARLVESLSQANAQLHHSSRHDPLTNLANRYLLTERLEHAIEHWHQAAHQFAVVYIDLDGFKVLNDNLGHDVGDQLLVRVARALTQVVRHGDTVARVGGDEFVVLLNNVASEHTIAIVCQKILAAVHSVHIENTHLSVSVGSASCPEHGEEAAQLIAAADQAMYCAKAAGKNQYARFEAEMAVQMADAFTIQKELGPAIETGQIVVFYQPKYAALDRSLTGAEALVRWKHPDKGLIPPDRFIPIAERSGGIDALETCVLTTVCAQVRTWLDAGFEVPCIAVNLSASRIRDPFLPGRVQACLKEWRLDARYLMFEITETVAIQEMLRAVDTLKRFTAMGLSVALDDFGTGHSSLSYLQRLPVQQLKIDRAFISGLGRHDPNEIAIVRSIISLAHNLNLRVVAEGVETEEQLAYLNQFECDEVQGFLFSKAVPADEFSTLITASATAETQSA